jgi:Fur family zinc uptake transcriptional regulator
LPRRFVEQGVRPRAEPRDEFLVAEPQRRLRSDLLCFVPGVWYNIATLRPVQEIPMQPRGTNHEQVYRVLRSAQGLMTAYEIIDAVRPKGISAPPTVYRALNRLMREGLAHRVESRNAYVACSDPDHRHASAVFAICRDCGHIDEMREGQVVQSLTKKLSRRGFVADRATIEIQGLCASCAGT